MKRNDILKALLPVFLSAAATAQETVAPSANPAQSGVPVVAALFVDNTAGPEAGISLPALANVLTAKLSKGGLRIVNPDPADASGANRPECARRLGANAIVTASIDKFGDSTIGDPPILHQYALRVTINLADSTGANVWGETVEKNSGKYTNAQDAANRRTYLGDLLHSAVEECAGQLLAAPAVRAWRPAPPPPPPGDPDLTDSDIEAAVQRLFLNMLTSPAFTSKYDKAQEALGRLPTAIVGGIVDMTGGKSPCKNLPELLTTASQGVRMVFVGSGLFDAKDDALVSTILKRIVESGNSPLEDGELMNALKCHGSPDVYAVGDMMFFTEGGADTYRLRLALHDLHTGKVVWEGIAKIVPSRRGTERIATEEMRVPFEMPSSDPVPGPDAANVRATVAANRKPLVAMLVVQNHVSDDFKKPLSDLGDRLKAALSGSVFRIIDPNDRIGDNLNRAPWGENLPESDAIHLAENLGAKVLVAASVGEASVTGIGNPVVAQCVGMTLTLSAMQVPSGATLGGVTVPETSLPMPPEVLGQSAESVYSKLVGKLVDNASARFLEAMAETEWTDEEKKTVTVFFGCNVLGADVEVNGFSCGTCPRQVEVTPGPHDVRVSYPPYYAEFRTKANLTENGQTFAIVLQPTPQGEEQRNRALEYEEKRAELELWKRRQELDIEAMGVDVAKKKRDLDFEFGKKKADLERELAEKSELFKKQLDLADAMLERYKLSGEADDYVRKTVADGMLLYWQNSYGRIAITDGTAKEILFTTPETKTDDIAAPPKSGDVAADLGKLLLGGK